MGYPRQLTAAQVVSLRKEYAALPRVLKKGYPHTVGLAALAGKYGISGTSVTRIVRRDHYRDIA